MRLGLFLRGPGILALVLAGAILATAAGHYGWLRGHAVHIYPRPATATPMPAPPAFSLAVTSHFTVSDPASGFEASLLDARVIDGNPPRKQLLLLARIALANFLPHTARSIGHGGFYAVTPTGQTYVATTTSTTGHSVGLPLLTSGALAPGRKATGWISFTIPAAPQTFVLVWSDDGRLVQPGMLATMSITRASVP